MSRRVTRRVRRKRAAAQVRRLKRFLRNARYGEASMWSTYRFTENAAAAWERRTRKTRIAKARRLRRAKHGWR